MLTVRPAPAAAFLGAALLALGLLAAPAAPAPALAESSLAAPPGTPGDAYLLRGGDATADQAAADALSAAGFTVTQGVETPAFTGAEANLADYDLVLALYNANIADTLSPAGASAIAGYVQGGGGLITGEWLTWQSQELGLADLAAVLPATSCGINTVGTTTFTTLVPNLVVNDGLPESFELPLANHSGSEGCLEPKDDAAVLYTSSNGGGNPGAAGLVLWNPPDSAGRVASFSTLLSAPELATAEARRLLQNTAAWVGGGRDLTPPTFREFSLSGAGTLTGSRNVSLAVRANDRGGARLGGIYIIEYLYSGNAVAPWQIARRSGWITWGNGANREFDWELTDDPGVHYIQAFLADRAGNVTPAPALDFVSYQPDVASIGLDELRIYHLRPPAGSDVRVRMEVAAGNPDLYVFSRGRPGLNFAPESDLPVEEIEFTSDGGVYQIEVEGYVAGSYRLSAGPPPAKAAAIIPSPQARPRSSIITIRSITPGDAELPPPPAEDGPAAVSRIIYLPLLSR